MVATVNDKLHIPWLARIPTPWLLTILLTVLVIELAVLTLQIVYG